MYKFLLPTGVLSEEQIRKKKGARRGMDEDVGSQSGVILVSPPSSPCPQTLARLSPEQQTMIDSLVNAQLQCNKRSFSDQPKVTVSIHTLYTVGVTVTLYSTLPLS